MTQPKEYKIYLSLENLLLLDGKVSEESQKVIDTAKLDASFGLEDPRLNEILRLAVKGGKLDWVYSDVFSCPACGLKGDYQTYPRSSRYHRKGDKNYKKPIRYFGVRVFRYESHYMCGTCWKKAMPVLIDYIISQDLKVEIQQNDYQETRYVVDDLRICYNCKREMYESEMGKLPTLMGRGDYPGVCPHCKAESRFLGSSHKTTDKFRLIEKK
jgi:hypothetical protein